QRHHRLVDAADGADHAVEVGAHAVRVASLGAALQPLDHGDGGLEVEPGTERVAATGDHHSAHGRVAAGGVERLDNRPAQLEGQAVFRLRAVQGQAANRIAAGDFEVGHCSVVHGVSALGGVVFEAAGRPT